MTLGSLFAGIGGFELAATWAGIEPVWSNEIDDYACKVLTKNFDHEIIKKDIREIGIRDLRSVDIISGGFPCQPFSQAGKRKGTDDNRYLWPEMLRVISELRPSYVIGENVAGLLSMENGETLKRILLDLENEGYHNEIFSIPACSVGAWHRRERIWITAIRNNGNAPCTDPDSERSHRQKIKQQGKAELRDKQISGIEGLGEDVSHSQSANNREQNRETEPTREIVRRRETEIRSKPERSRKAVSNTNRINDDDARYGTSKNAKQQSGQAEILRNEEYWITEPSVGRVANGIPNRVDRLKGLGNAIVPQVAYEIFKSIVEIDGRLDQNT